MILSPGRPPPRRTPLQRRLAGMWASGMSMVAIRRALALSEAEAMALGIFPPPRRGRARPRAAPSGAPAGARDGPLMAEALEAVARECGLDPGLIAGRSQSEAAVRARQLAIHLLRGLCAGASLPAIGHAIRRDHTTVLHGLRRAEARLSAEPGFRVLHERVRARLDRGRA